jgi:hypothetical protein
MHALLRLCSAFVVLALIRVVCGAHQTAVHSGVRTRVAIGHKRLASAVFSKRVCADYWTEGYMSTCSRRSGAASAQYVSEAGSLVSVVAGGIFAEDQALNDVWVATDDGQSACSWNRPRLETSKS